MCKVLDSTNYDKLYNSIVWSDLVIENKYNPSDRSGTITISLNDNAQYYWKVAATNTYTLNIFTIHYDLLHNTIE
jgi:hypothetical protein